MHQGIIQLLCSIVLIRKQLTTLETKLKSLNSTNASVVTVERIH